MEQWALFFHLLGAFVFVGGLTVAAVGFEAARRKTEPAEIALLLGLTRWGVALVAGGGIVVLACGFWLAGEVHANGDGWLDVALALFIATVALGIVGGQRPKKARKLAESGGDPAEIRRLLDDPVGRAINYAGVVLVLAILVLMVWRPGA